MSKVVGIDLGGTKIAALILDTGNAQAVHRKAIATQSHQGPDAVIKRMANLVREICQEAGQDLTGMRGVGVGIPAVVDYERGCALLMPNLPGAWHGKPIADILSEHIELPAWLINDARAFTLAEANLGAGRGAHTVACFTLGTGIGGGIAIGGQLHLGMDGNAGEFGHHTIDLNGLPDGSGTPGALEGFASGPAIAAMGVKAVMQGFTTNIGELAGYDLNRITPQIIRQAAETGDAVAADIFQRAGTYIGVGIANVVTILCPDCVVLGGGVAQLGDWIMKPIRSALKRYANTVSLDRLRVAFAELGEDAGAIGAALWAAHKQGIFTGN